MWYASLDLGQKNDYSALSIIEQVEYTPPIAPKAGPNELVVTTRKLPTERPRPTYYVDHLERWRGLDYVSVAEAVKARLEDERLAGCRFVLDYTGVGIPVMDLFRRMGLRPIGITITGGQAVTRTGDHCYGVPKRDLAITAAVLLEEHRFKVNAALDLASVLGREMLNFKPKIDAKTLHDSYAVWREGMHDDLILSVAMGLWYAESKAPRPVRYVKLPKSWQSGGYNTIGD